MQPTYFKKRGFALTRRFRAPVAAVWSAWTEPEQLGWFFNPDNATTVPITVDLRVGGEWRQEMVISPTDRYMTGGLFTEIVPGVRLQFLHGARGGWPDLEPEPADCPRCTMSLVPIATGTQMLFEVQLPDHLSEARVKEWMECGMVPGWNMTIDRLLPEKREAA